MSNARKRSGYNERITLAHERKEWVEESRRIARMELEMYMAACQRQKRSNIAAKESN